MNFSSNNPGAVFASPRARPIGRADPMPWGKHKGIPIDQVPRDYLAWCLREMDACNPHHERFWPEFRAAIESLVGSRPSPPPPGHSLPACLSLLAAGGYRLRVVGDQLLVEPPPPPDLADALASHRTALLAVARLTGPGGTSIDGPWDRLRSRLKGAYRALSIRFHPDRGGSDAQMALLNEVYRSFQDIITEMEDGQS